MRSSPVNAKKWEMDGVIDYSLYRKPSRAIDAYLDEMQKPQTKETVARALVEGGYMRDSQQPYWVVISAIDYFVGIKTLVERNGLIGKPDWPKDLFVTQKRAAIPEGMTALGGNFVTLRLLRGILRSLYKLAQLCSNRVRGAKMFR